MLLLDAGIKASACARNSTTSTSGTTRDWRLFNVLLLGVTFLFLFTTFQTCSMVQVRNACTANGILPRKTAVLAVCEIGKYFFLGGSLILRRGDFNLIITCFKCCL